MKKLETEDWFELHTQDITRLWKPPPAAMETVVELFNEDHLAYPHIPQVFAIPKFDETPVDKAIIQGRGCFSTINVGPSFWPCSIYKPIILFFVLSLAHVKNFRGPWVQRWSTPDLELHNQLEYISKNPELYGCRKIHDLEGPVHVVQ